MVCKTKSIVSLPPVHCQCSWPGHCSPQSPLLWCRRRSLTCVLHRPRFLLHYISRDEVALFERGTGGVPEVRSTVDAYEEVAPLYGFLQYRRRKVVLSYLPEGLSRLVQGNAIHPVLSVSLALDIDAILLAQPEPPSSFSPSSINSPPTTPSSPCRNPPSSPRARCRPRVSSTLPQVLSPPPRAHSAVAG